MKNNIAYSIDIQDFDLCKTLDSGQVFSWLRSGDIYLGTHRRNSCVLAKADTELFYMGTENQFQQDWAEYFDLNIDYTKLFKDLSLDPFAAKAVESGRGIRIVRQDPWEMLVTMMLTTRNRIPNVANSIRKMYNSQGDSVIDATTGLELNVFPTPTQLLSSSNEDWGSYRLGYRLDFVADATRFCKDNPTWLQDIAGLPTKELTAELERLKGVGPKVSNCVALFAYHRYDAFPVDIWIERALAENYRGSTIEFIKKYGEYAGLIQQFIFYYRRNKIG